MYNSWINSKESDILSTLSALISFKSVEDTPSAGAPFGIENKRALEYALSKAKELGIKNCVDLSGYAGFAEAGEGEEMLGILCHLDVVPAGEGWESDPFSATLRDGKIFGRGACDDKGPAVCAMFALASLIASGKKFRRRVRIIFGSNEETGWGCMKHYKEHSELPTLAFSPDGEYPVVNSERGILHAGFKKEFSSQITLSAGTRANVVPSRAVAYVKIKREDIVGKNCPLPFEVEEKEDGSVITVYGEEAHASTPENGKNALCAILALLSQLDLSKNDADTVRFLHFVLKNDRHGESLGIDYADESGRLTVNPAIIKWGSGGIEKFVFDLRCPHSKSCDAVLKELSDALLMETVSSSHQDALFVPPDSELVKTLLSVYCAETGESDARPKSIGGGTYARAFKNAVAFGCERDGVDNRIHMPNEFMSVEDIMFNTRIIARAIDALA